MKAVLNVCLLVGVTGWSLMLAVGILRSVGAVDWTLSYDEATALAALGLLPVSMVVALMTAAVGRAADAGGSDRRPDPQPVSRPA